MRQDEPRGGAEPGAEARTRAAGQREAPGDGVLTLVCFKCGAEYHFADRSPPDDLRCDRCEGTVFRSFFTPEAGDEAAAEFRDSTARDMDPDDPSTDTMPGDVLDLNRD